MPGRYGFHCTSYSITTMLASTTNWFPVKLNLKAINIRTPTFLSLESLPQKNHWDKTSVVLISSSSMLERVYHIIIDQSPLPVTKQDFRIKALSTVCFPRQFKTWVSYKSCITRPIVTSWLERSPCFRYVWSRFSSTWWERLRIIALQHQSKRKQNIFNFTSKMFRYFKGL